MKTTRTYTVKYLWERRTYTYRSTDSLAIAFAALDYLHSHQRHLKPWLEAK